MHGCNSAKSGKDARISPFLPEGIATVEGLTFFFFFFHFCKNVGRLTLNRNPDHFVEKDLMSLYLLRFL